MMQSHTSCICFFFLHCALSSNRLIQWRHSHIGYICLAFPHCELSNESSNCISEKIHNYTGCIFWIFLQCVLKYFFQIQCKKDAMSHWLHLVNLSHSNVSVNCLQLMHIRMSLQVAFLRRIVITLFAFARFFSSVYSLMFL